MDSGNLAFFKIPMKDEDMSFSDFVLDELSGATGANLMLPQVCQVFLLCGLFTRFFFHKS